MNPAQPAPKRFGGYAALVAAGIMLSRVAGLVRTSVFAHYLGTSGAADAFNVALKIPNFLQNLLGEGVLSAAFIPVYSRLLGKGEQKTADRVAGVFVSFLLLIVIVIVIGGVILTPFILSITVPGLAPDVRAMAIKFTRIIFPGVGLLVLYAWALGILNAHRQFFISYVAPVLWSVTMIITLVVFGLRMSGAELATALAWGCLIGMALQFAIEIPFVLKHAKHLSFGFDRSLEPVRTIFRNILPVVGGRGVVQISAYVDTFIASLLPTGSVTILGYAQALYMLPISVFGMSVAAAELPQMASELGSEEEIHGALRRRLDRGVRQMAFFVIPTTIAFLLIGRLLVAALFQRGRFTPEDTLLVWYVLCGSAIGLLVSTLGRLYSSAFYALHDTKTPVRIAMVRVFLGTALAALFAIAMRPVFISIFTHLGLPVPATSTTKLGVVGISTASAIAAWVEFLLLRSRMNKRIGEGDSKMAYMIKLWIAAIIGGIVAVIADIYVFHGAAARLPLPRISEAILASMTFGIVYFASAAMLGVPEVRAFLGRFIKR
ncbi:MAG TPA: murein biosynthesis integral membrane protein MurJ [Thermoanaerobaculia bacterium]|jgi:putative peptidoglycan lipid II flippase|nr:murein biosynthesis integral membrane protein MurJ [Thermoanaerobaculia bacterium]